MHNTSSSSPYIYSNDSPPHPYGDTSPMTSGHHHADYVLVDSSESEDMDDVDEGTHYESTWVENGGGPEKSVHPFAGYNDEVERAVEQLQHDVAAILEALTRIETRMGQISKPQQQRKRKATRTPEKAAKKQKLQACHQVNLRPIKAYLEDYLDLPPFSWQRGASGKHCWVGDWDGGEREEVEAVYLLSYGSALSVELRGNGDWLPIKVRFNEERDVFEGQDSLDSNTRLEIDADTMFDLMSGIGDAHVGLIKDI